MPKSLFNKYIWMVDTIRRRGRITRAELDERWRQTDWADGNPLCRRTLYNYRQAIEQLFGITIQCDPATYEYYITDEDDNSRSVTDWLLNSSAVNEALSGARDISDRIFLDDVPSAREHLGTVIDAIRTGRRIVFDYHNYARSRPTRAIRYEPYLLKIYRQRWYMVGRTVGDNKIKTYALDRMSNVTQTADSYTMPADFDPAAYFHDSFGIIVTRSEPRRIAIRADHRNANYLRGLPLHHSQQEVVHDGFSIFYYNMRITDDLVQELLSFGPRITVLEPPELRALITTALRESLANYQVTAQTRGSSVTNDKNT